MHGRKLLTAPAVEPVSLSEAKSHLRVDVDADDTYIGTLIVAARQFAEAYTHRQLVTAVWQFTYDRFPVGIRPLPLPLAPLASVDEITYVDEAGDDQTYDAADYDVWTALEPGIVQPAFDTYWPTARRQPASVTIEATLGYGNAAAVPQAIKQAMLLMIGHWYENREEVAVGTIATQVPLAAQHLLEQFTYGDEFTDYSPESCD